jgi:predicted nucleotidyltransferase
MKERGYEMKPEVQEQIDKIKDIIIQTIPVEQVYLFGSYAYGTPRDDSDLDFYVVMKDDAPFQEINAEGMIRNAIYGKKSLSTDILVIKKARFDYRRSATTLEREVATKGVLLYG